MAQQQQQQRIIFSDRGQHAGTLAFFVLVPLADLVGAALTYLYGTTIGTWLFSVVWWAIVGIGDGLQHHFLEIIAILIFGLLMWVAFKVKSLENKVIAVLLSFVVVGVWCLLHLLFKIEWNTPLLSALPDLHQFTFNFPDIRLFFAQPNWGMGVIWVMVYPFLHFGWRQDVEQTPIVVRRPAQVKDAADGRAKTVLVRTWEVAAPVLAGYVPSEVEGKLEPRDALPGTKMTNTITLNTFDALEDKWRILTTCVQFYQEALTRLYPPPFRRLKVPPRKRMRYISQQDDQQVTWHGGTLVFAESLFQPIHEDRLLVQFARRLWECNSPDRRLRGFMSAYPKFGWAALLLALFGQGLIVPVAARGLLNWRDWRADRVLAADRFVWACGQGERLLHQLYQWIDAGLEEPDPYLPRYAERRGHLEGLLRGEQTEMVRQGLTPAYPLDSMQATSSAAPLPTGRTKQQQA
jgi:hypothetical protein